MNDKSSPISIDLGGLSKPATVLVERISNAVGIIYEPTRNKRLAKANVEVEKIKALGNFEINEIKHRTLSRLNYEEIKKQENIESIIAQATAQIEEGAKPEEIEDD